MYFLHPEIYFGEWRMKIYFRFKKIFYWISLLQHSIFLPYGLLISSKSNYVMHVICNALLYFSCSNILIRTCSNLTSGCRCFSYSSVAYLILKLYLSCLCIVGCYLLHSNVLCLSVLARTLLQKRFLISMCFFPGKMKCLNNIKEMPLQYFEFIVNTLICTLI